MKNVFIIAILFALVAVSFAQNGDYSHFVAGNFRRLGPHAANDFGIWDTAGKRWMDIPMPSVGSGQLRDFAVTSNGKVLGVGDFTSLNGAAAYGVIFYDGNNWCAMPHMNLYYVVRPLTEPSTFPKSNGVAGKAFAVVNEGNDFYVLGGSTSSFTNHGTLSARVPNFNAAGSVGAGVGGLVKFTFDGNNNFTVGALNYFDQGGDATTATTGAGGSNSSFAFAANNAPVLTSKPKKVLLHSYGAAGIALYVHAGAGSNIMRWRTNDNTWLSITTNTTGVSAYHSSSMQTWTINGPALSGAIQDFDLDSNGDIYVAGTFNNFLAPDHKYFLLAKTTGVSPATATTNSDWTLAANLPQNIFNGTGSDGAWSIAVESTTKFYFSVTFRDSANSDAQIAAHQQRRVYSVTNAGAPQLVGSNFGRSGSSSLPNVNLWWANSKLYAFGNFDVYNQQYSSGTTRTRRYITRLSGWSVWDASASTWNEVAGGGLYNSGTTNSDVDKVVATSDKMYFLAQGANIAFDAFSRTGIAAFNKKSHKKNWDTFGTNRLTTVSSPRGADGVIRAVHHITKQRPNIKDAVLVGGTFEWYGLDRLGSVAYLRTDTGAFEPIGGGLWNDVATFHGDESPAIDSAGAVWDLEERDGKFYAAGTFRKNGNGECVRNIAKYDISAGGVWKALGAGCDALIRDLYADGDKVYVGGDFTSCGGNPAARRIAYYDEDKNQWKALQNGLDSNVYAIEKFKGKLYVGGFANQPGGLRTLDDGLVTWDGKKWEPVIARCTGGCRADVFTYPFTAQGPILGGDVNTRTVGDVSSLRRRGRKLFIQGTVKASGSDYLISWDGKRLRQEGIASRGTCSKQGCISTNSSDAVGVGWTVNGISNSLQHYSDSKKNWYASTGFDVDPIVISASSPISAPIAFIAIVISCIVLLF